MQMALNVRRLSNIEINDEVLDANENDVPHLLDLDDQVIQELANLRIEYS